MSSHHIPFVASPVLARTAATTRAQTPNPSRLPSQPQITAGPETNRKKTGAIAGALRSRRLRPAQIITHRHITQTPTKRHPIKKNRAPRAGAAMLQVRASPTFLPSTSSSSSQAPTHSPFSGKSQRRGGLAAAPSANRVARRSGVVMAAAAAAAKLEDADALIDSVETFIFDCDGQIPHRSPPASWVVGVCAVLILLKLARVFSACAAQV